jgi:glutathione S-transferase
MYTLYSMQRSGNSYKVRLALARLAIPFQLVEIDILQGESHTPEFLAKNPNGQVPLLEVMPGRFLAESNAILWYVAGGTPLAPEDRIDRAEALQWMFFEQHSLEPNIGAAYFWLNLVKGGRELQSHALDDWMEEGHRALGVMDKHLRRNRFFAADRSTIADIAVYAYTHVAHECGYDLDGFAAIRAWLARVAAEPGHVPMEWSPAAAVAAKESGGSDARTRPDRPEFQSLRGYSSIVRITTARMIRPGCRQPWVRTRAKPLRNRGNSVAAVNEWLTPHCAATAAAGDHSIGT